MTTTTKTPEQPRPPEPAVDDGNQEVALRTLSTKTYRRTIWTPGLIQRRILERERAGLSLNAIAVQRDSITLLSAARRHFGSWDEAVAKAHNTAAGRIVAHTRDTIIFRLLEHAATGLPMLTIYPITKACYKPAVRLFGSWAAAVRAAGLEPCERKTKSIASAATKQLREVNRPVDALAPSIVKSISANQHERFSWTKEMVIEKIHTRKRLHLSIKYMAVRRDARDLLEAALRLFGTWRTARYAAEMPGKGKYDCTREQIVDILRERGRTGKSVSSLHPDMRPYLHITQRLFGSWTKAREEAGCGRPKPFTRDEVLAALVKVFAEGRIPHMRAPDLRPYVPAACRIFGKWLEAIRQANELWSQEMQELLLCTPEDSRKEST